MRDQCLLYIFRGCVQLNPPELDLCEDLSDLVSVNESSALHTLTSRAKGYLPLTHAGPNLLALWPPLSSPAKVRSVFLQIRLCDMYDYTYCLTLDIVKYSTLVVVD